MVAATAPLIEPGAPPWALRFALRLQQTFWPVFPSQPQRVWNAGPVSALPPPAAWPGAIVQADGALWMSDGVAWTMVGSGVPPGTTTPTPPQFDASTLIANTTWVERRGLQSSGRYVLAANTVLTAQHAGAHIQFGANNITLTLPSAASFPAGTQIWFWGGATNGNAVKPAGAELIYLGSGGVGVASIAMGAGDSLVLSSLGSVTGWAADLGSVQLSAARAFDHLLQGAVAGSFQRLPGGLLMQWGSVAPSAINTQQAFVLPTAFSTGGTALVLTPYSGAGVVAKAQGYFPDTTHLSVSTDTAGISISYVAVGA